jgi:hypothetical protein
MSVAKNGRFTQRVTQYLASSSERMFVTRELIHVEQRKMCLPSRILFLLVTASLLASLVGCSSTAVEDSPVDSYLSGNLQFGSRELRYTLVGGGEVEKCGSPLTALITFANGWLMVDSDGIKLDDGEQLSWPKNADIVRVHFDEGRLQIFANGMRVYQAMHEGAAL